METYVVGKIGRAKADNGSMQGVIDRLSPVGYHFTEKADYLEFNKVGRVESIITELVPVCEDHGLDVEDFQMIEFRESDGQERSRFEDGQIIRKE